PELTEDQKAGERRTEHSELGQHFSVGRAGRDAFLYRKMGAGEHYEVHDGRDCEEINDDAPIRLHDVCERNGQDTASDETRRPARMEDIEPLGLLAVEEGRDHRIDERLDGAVSEPEDDGTCIEVAPCLGACLRE